MNPERFRQIRELFLEALQQKPEQRDDFLQRACLGDEALHQELASLLAEHDKKDHFLEPSTPNLKTQPTMEGRSIGPYRIDREIGRGGMGVVYLAEDTRLHRSVALKALAPALLVDAKQKERLRREARAAASLSHPSIATVYALEEFEGDLYVVSEYVRGGTCVPISRRALYRWLPYSRLRFRPQKDSPLRTKKESSTAT